MGTKIVWLAAGCLIGLSTLAISCSSSPAAPTQGNQAPQGQQTGAPAASPTAASKPGGASMTPSPGTATEAPKYGGVFNGFVTASPTTWDQGLGVSIPGFQMQNNYLTNEDLVASDWARGPAGTNEFTFVYAGGVSYDDKAPALAESWQIAEPGHMVLKIRQGIHFGLDPNNEASKLVNGREMTADDVAYSLNRIIKTSRYIRGSAPNMCANTTITAPDKYSLDLRYPPEETMNVYTLLVLNGSTIPKEVVDKYGDLEDWSRSVGPGPFMLTNYVSGSALTFVKNPTYWRKDPAGPGKGNQLPYLDGVKLLVLPDPSTRLTAMRTGKIDWMGGFPALTKDDFDNLKSTMPNLQSLRFLGDTQRWVNMRIDKQDQPFKDVRVRQALTMAIDYKSIVTKLMQGDADYPGFPVMNAPDFKSVYFPLSEATQASQDIYSYNPTKAKQLLADAGYPNGFSTTVIADGAGGVFPDQLALFKEYWSKIGIDLTIKPEDTSVFGRDQAQRNFDQMMYGGGGSFSIYIKMGSFVGQGPTNGSYIDDPRAKQTQSEMLTAMAKGDKATADQIYKDFAKYAMEQAWVIPFPRAYNYVVWQPWLKNYHGETTVSYSGLYSWTKYVWLDQDLKKSMGVQ